jgi:hypothetical protein
MFVILKGDATGQSSESDTDDDEDYDNQPNASSAASSAGDDKSLSTPAPTPSVSTASAPPAPAAHDAPSAQFVSTALRTPAATSTDRVWESLRCCRHTRSVMRHR